ncbi:VCBS repeat-containing protein [Bradyrhizobium sp. AUGA SZCCT0431]|uniref:FG-GAP repeat domain-containing protein n=1 Tax=Bradyrhizobium sp. AUGA SZCCT0431 TaxID=2807674 RepID=UPI001BA523B8|nr:VCBS repeat-containing protein [Bradyrhizobium sp. AUGA SZCCT0431]MBR1147546.1 VCBS repeat-containing protein [Bradyrhizobium sp. AUGA SZCCT0431]
MIKHLRPHAARFATAAIVLALYGLASYQVAATDDQRPAIELPTFAASYIEPADNGQPMRGIRDVHPDLKRIDAWISSVGAGVALADISDTGRPADICLVDPRNDSVSVLPAPGTGRRFIAFSLPVPTEGYDSTTIAPMGCLPADVNEDGRMDLVVYYWGRPPIAFLRNDAQVISAAAFTPVEIFAGRENWNTNAAIFSDIDGDGHPDLVFGNYFPDGERVLDVRATTNFQMQHSMSRAFNGGRNRLLLWQGSTATTVTYRDASDAFTPEMANGWTLALAARDLDGDLIELIGERLAPYRHLPEIYVANDFGPDRLLLNRSRPGHPRFELVDGDRDFTTPRSKVLGQDSFKGMGVDFGDVGGDGRAAIAVSNISSPYALLESHFLFINTGNTSVWLRGKAPYRDESFKRGIWTSSWAWDIKFVDLLNSGHPALLQAIGFVRGQHSRWPELQELAMANDELLLHPASWPRVSVGDDLSGGDHDRLFLPGAEGIFHDVWSRLGLDSQTVSRGIATGDVFGDGRLSVVIARQWSPSLFLHNTSANAGRAIVFDLRLPGHVAGSRAAIGAEAKVVVSDNDKQRIVTSVVDGGSGHGGKRAQEIHLGVGRTPDNELLDVNITWRDESGVRSETIRAIPGRYQIVLGEAECRQAFPVNESLREGSCRVASSRP